MRLALVLLALCANAQNDSPAFVWTGRVDALLDRMMRSSAGVLEVSGGHLGVGDVGPEAASPGAAACDDHEDRKRRLFSLKAIEQVLVNHGLPRELIAVAQAESALNPHARSPRGAAGLWQLMPGTARQFGLPQEKRTDAVLSSAAAARLLRYLYSRFADWRLALAAYNAGEGAVQRAIEQAGSRDFAEIARQRLLPQETLRYVPQVEGLRRTRTPVESKAGAAAVIVWATPQ